MSALDCLADELRWVAWRLEERGGKPTKIPYDPTTGRHAKADVPATWGTRALAETRVRLWVNGYDHISTSNLGVGIEFGDLGADTYLGGVDLDSCITEDGSLAPWAAAILAALPTYCERSPSGTGIKAFFYVLSDDARPFLEAIGITNPEQWGTKRSVGERGGDHGPGVEIYLSGRFFVVTDQRWPGKPEQIARLDRDALEKLARLVPPLTLRTSDKSGRGGRDNSRSAKAFREGVRLRRAGKSFDEMCAALRSHSDPDISGWCREKGDDRALHRIWDKADPQTASTTAAGVSLEDFYAYMPMHAFIFAPTGELWPAASVNARIPPISAGVDEGGKPKSIPAATWLDRNRPVEQMTWAPGLPKIIPDRLISLGGWIDRAEVNCFNLYRPPNIRHGDSSRAKRWLVHLRKIYPDEAKHIVAFLAHRVQHPAEKINHALMLGGVPGIGKDTILEPVKYAVGPWNFAEVSPKNILGTTNAFAKSVVLRVSEARDLGDFDRFAFFEAMKGYCAAPPDVIRVNEKHIREYYVPNVCGVIITTNHKTDGIHLPADDRRHFVCWSPAVKADFSEQYWHRMWRWYDNGGINHVAAYLASYDLRSFNPKAAPPQTRAFWEIVQAGRVPENAELADLIDKLDKPNILTISRLVNNLTASKEDQDFKAWITDRKNSRRIPHRLEDCGYVAVRNPNADDGLWRVFGKRQAIYGKISLTHDQRLAAAAKLAGG